jgi:hypothetical protein
MEEGDGALTDIIENNTMEEDKFVSRCFFFRPGRVYLTLSTVRGICTARASSTEISRRTMFCAMRWAA